MKTTKFLISNFLLVLCILEISREQQNHILVAVVLFTSLALTYSLIFGIRFYRQRWSKSRDRRAR